MIEFNYLNKIWFEADNGRKHEGKHLSTWVPLERPVLRPSGTDNSVHRQATRQP